MKTIIEPLQVQVAKKGPPPVVEVDPATEQVRYVKIDGKLYEFNPRHTYTVNGVQTMYKNGNPKTLEQYRAENEAAKAAMAKAFGEDDQAGAKVQGMIQNNVLSVYTPGGAQAVIDGAHEAAANMNKRNQALEEVEKQ